MKSRWTVSILAALIAALVVVSTGWAAEPVTLKIIAFIGDAEPAGVMENPVAQQIAKELNILMDMTPMPGEADYPNQLSAMIASEDLPDIFILPTADTEKFVAMLVKSGQVKEIDDALLQKYAPNIMAQKTGQAMIELHKKNISPNGKLYTIGLCRGTWDGGTQPLVGNFIRWDLYKKLGYPKLETFDEDLLNVLAEMQKLEPTTPDGQNVYALSGWFGDAQGWGDWPFTYTLAFTEGFTYLSADRTITADMITNKPSEVNALTEKNSPFWRAVKFYSKANRMGILDPEAFTQKWDQYDQRVKAGRYLYNTPGWLVADMNKNFVAAGLPDKGFVALPPLNSEAFGLIGENLYGERSYVISAKCKHPEKALQLLDWISSYQGAMVMWNGPEGLNWKMVDGQPVPTDEFLKASGADREFMKNTGALIFHHFVGFGGGTINPETKTPVSLYDYSAKALDMKLLPVHKDLLAHYKAASLPELYKSKAKVWQSVSLYKLGQISDDLKTYETSLQAYVFKELFQVILAKDDADFEKRQDAMIKGLDKFKVNEIFAYWKSKADEQYQAQAPILEMIK